MHHGLSILVSMMLFVFLLASCGGRKDTLRLRGKFENLDQAQFLLYSPDGGMTTIDTLQVSKGEFDYQKRLPDAEVYTFVIIYPNFMTFSFQAHAGTEVLISGDALSLSQVKAEGADSIIRPDTVPRKHPITIGKTLPKSKTIHHKRGTYLLISFWAEWKHGSSTVNYYIRKALSEHPDSLYAFSYSLDVDPELDKVKQSITDSTRWETYCDYTAWSAPLLSKFGIRNIPHMILVNPKGMVIAMGNEYNRDIKPQIDKIQDKKK